MIITDHEKRLIQHYYNGVLQLEVPLEEAFDPNEKRDESGKWTSGGGGKNKIQEEYSNILQRIKKNHGGNVSDVVESYGIGLRPVSCGFFNGVANGIEHYGFGSDQLEKIADDTCVAAALMDGTLGDRSLKRLANRTYILYPGYQEARDAYNKRILEINPKTKPTDLPVCGWYHAKSREIHSSHREPNDSRMDVLIHECGHALDHGKNTELYHSETNNWHNCWYNDLERTYDPKTGFSKLGRMGAINPVEGWAEFHRYMNLYGKEKAKRYMPEMYSYWEERGLI